MSSAIFVLLQELGIVFLKVRRGINGCELAVNDLSHFSGQRRRVQLLTEPYCLLMDNRIRGIDS